MARRQLIDRQTLLHLMVDHRGEIRPASRAHGCSDAAILSAIDREPALGELRRMAGRLNHSRTTEQQLRAAKARELLSAIPKS